MASPIDDDEVNAAISGSAAGEVPLCRVMKSHGSDKGGEGAMHNYTTLYEPLLGPRLSAQPTARIFEVGIGTNFTDVPSNMGTNGRPGASLRGWAEWMPNAEVFGADIDKRVLFQDPAARIATFYVDQRSPEAIAEMWREPALAAAPFDLIVDDGLHEFEANDTFLRASHDRLRPGGIYIIEDVLREDATRFEDAIRGPDYRAWFAYTRIVRLPHARNAHDNTLLVLQTRA